MDSGCDSDGRAVAFKSRGPRFESSHQQNLYVHSVNCIEKTKINKKEAGDGPFFKKEAKNGPFLRMIKVGR